MSLPIHPSTVPGFADQTSSLYANSIELKTKSAFARFASEFPWESLAFAAAAMTLRLFALTRQFSVPLAGVSVGLFAGKLFIKAAECINPKKVEDLTKNVAEYKKHNLIQAISFLGALTLTIYSITAAAVAGGALGIYAATVLDSDRYIAALQEMNRPVDGF